MGNEAVSLSLSSGGRRSAHPGKAGVESVLEIRVPELSADIDGGLSLTGRLATGAGLRYDDIAYRT